jgi:hypothetical protein
VYIKQIEENNYKCAIYKSLKDQPISNFMHANCKALSSNALFRFNVKARNKTSIIQFTRHIINNQGNKVCNLCLRDNQDIVDNILNGFSRWIDYHTERHDLVINRL